MNDITALIGLIVTFLLVVVGGFGMVAAWLLSCFDYPTMDDNIHDNKPEAFK